MNFLERNGRKAVENRPVLSLVWQGLYQDGNYIRIAIRKSCNGCIICPVGLGRTSRIHTLLQHQLGDISEDIGWRKMTRFESLKMAYARPHKLLRIGAMPTGRIEAFSDGVFAIVVTLLVLEIHVPQLPPSEIGQLSARLLAMAPKFFIYALSFAIICIWWVAHHHFFYLLNKSDRGLLWFNCIFLLFLAFIPFPTALMGDYPNQRIAVICYGGVMTLTGLSFSWMRYYAFFVAKLADEQLEQRILKRAMIKSALNPMLHLMAVSLAFLNIKLSIAMYVLIPVLFFFPTLLEKHDTVKVTQS